MRRTNRPAAALAICAAVPAASADVIVSDPSILAPFEFTEVSVEWIGSDAGYTGELAWINPDIPTVSTTLFNNKQATQGQSYSVPRLYVQGERVDFSYGIIRGSSDFFTTTNQNDWAQFNIDASDPLNVVVGVEDIRLPGGDSDFNDVMFRVRFSQSAIPAPGAMGLLAMSSVALIRRRRR
jgi:uncharacterized protein (TIGR03382 family)